MHAVYTVATTGEDGKVADSVVTPYHLVFVPNKQIAFPSAPYSGRKFLDLMQFGEENERAFSDPIPLDLMQFAEPGTTLLVKTKVHSVIPSAPCRCMVLRSRMR